MRVLVIGSGGREHALVKAISASPLAEAVYALPGNPGIKEAVCLPGNPMDIGGTLRTALDQRIDFCVVAPEDPLAAGLVDALEAGGVPCFGPDRFAARIETSKAFAKNLMRRHGIPTARFQTFDRLDAALAYIRDQAYPLVVKADGLARGKGVVIAENEEEAAAALKDMLSGRAFGKSGAVVVVEEALSGPEVSLMCLTDGQTILPLVSAMDHKRALDHDLGPNTGGMGAIAPNPFLDAGTTRAILEQIMKPLIAAMHKEGYPFRGCLFAGLMLTPEGPKVLEFNARFGDPETQAVLPLMDSDLLSHLLACREGRLEKEVVRFRKGASCCLVLASGGYPGAYNTGFPIHLGQTDAAICFAGVTAKDGQLLTAGGRVMSLTATAASLREAISAAYQAAAQVSFTGCTRRGDIGQKALEVIESA